jgi:hypothetical protein
LAKSAKAPADPLKADFRKFVYVLLTHLGLTPTLMQYDICLWLQHGPDRRIVEAFRGASKSWLTAFYTCWLLYCDPDHKVLVVSATGGRAQDFSQFVLRLIREVPCLRHLTPRDDQRSSVLKFEVNGAKPDQSPSVQSAGIDGQITGSRADTIILDDVEVPANSDTEGKRAKLDERTQEVEAILKPGGQVVVLGTPQTEDSIYPKMEAARGYSVRIWPALHPSPDERAFYAERLAPFVAARPPELAGKPVEPERFSEDDMAKRQAGYGRSGFCLQFQLDTRMSDRHRYPLKLSDLMVMECNDFEAPEKPVWAASPELAWNDLYNPGLTGDRMYRPMRIQGSFVPYQGAALHVDPAGRGKDELGYAVTKSCNGFVYVLAAGGLLGGYDERNLAFLADLAKRYRVNYVGVEKNFGDGMFTALLQPFLQKSGYPVTVEETRSTGQKERRIIDVLEPVLNQHRLVFAAAMIRDDHRTAQDRDGDDKRAYQLLFQLTHVTKERGSLAHDDRLDALAMAVAYWQSILQRDADKSMAQRKQELLDIELRKFLKAAGKTSKVRDRKWASVR